MMTLQDTTRRCVDETLLRLSPLAHKVAASVQRSEQDHMDLYQEGMMALYTALLSYIGTGKDINNLTGFAGTVLRRRMLRFYYRQRHTSKHVELKEALSVPVEPEAEGYSGNSMLTDDFFDAFEQRYGAEARRCAEGCLRPSRELLLYAARQAVKPQPDEQHDEYMLRVERHTLNMKITKRAVRRFYNVKPHAFFMKHMPSLQEFTRSWLSTRAKAA